MRKVLFLLTTGLLSLETYSQECFLYYPKQPNSRLEYNCYSKNELDATVVKEYTFQNEELDTLLVFEKAEVFDLQGNSTASAETKSMCVKGYYYRGNIPSLNIKILPGEFLTSVGGNIWQGWPTKLNVGDTLTGYITTVSVFTKGATAGDIVLSTIGFGLVGAILTVAFTPSLSFNTQTDIFDRKVETIEEITTMAGTFECYKITFHASVSKITPNKKSSKKENIGNSATISWYATNIGLVKQEEYDGDGNLSSYMVLTNIK